MKCQPIPKKIGEKWSNKYMVYFQFPRNNNRHLEISNLVSNTDT